MSAHEYSVVVALRFDTASSSDQRRDLAAQDCLALVGCLLLTENRFGVGVVPFSVTSGVRVVLILFPSFAPVLARQCEVRDVSVGALERDRSSYLLLTAQNGS
jgi:hypothetical protein